MGNIDKGVIVSIEGPEDRCGDFTLARVSPSSRSEVVSHLLTIPWHMREATGNLQVGDEVAYVLFEDNTGVVISRMDGNWAGILVGNIQIAEGGNEKGDLDCNDITNNNITNSNISTTDTIKCKNLISSEDTTAQGVSLYSHTHQLKNVRTGPNTLTTEEPKKD